MSTTAGVRNRCAIAPLVRQWRQRRRLSRDQLARAAGVSARELAHVETGRERPSRELLLALADGLELPARERDGLLSAAGHAPPAAGDADLEPMRAALAGLLERHEPFPALAVDREWTLVAANAAWPLLTHDVAPALLEPPVNVVRLALDPAGLARHVVDLEAWRALAQERLRRAGLAELAAEVAAFPEPDGARRAGARRVPARPAAQPVRHADVPARGHDVHDGGRREHGRADRDRAASCRRSDTFGRAGCGIARERSMTGAPCVSQASNGAARSASSTRRAGSPPTASCGSWTPSHRCRGRGPLRPPGARHLDAHAPPIRTTLDFDELRLGPPCCPRDPVDRGLPIPARPRPQQRRQARA